MRDGWVVPPANDSNLYNGCASENQFRVGDYIRVSHHLIGRMFNLPSSSVSRDMHIFVSQISGTGRTQ